MYKPWNKEKSGLDTAIDEILTELRSVNADTDEYAKMSKQLVKLYKLKEVDSKKRVSPDVLATVAANILGIVIIVGHERAHVITSKGMGFIRQMR